MVSRSHMNGSANNAARSSPHAERRRDTIRVLMLRYTSNDGWYGLPQGAGHGSCGLHGLAAPDRATHQVTCDEALGTIARPGRFLTGAVLMTLRCTANWIVDLPLSTRAHRTSVCAAMAFLGLCLGPAAFGQPGRASEDASNGWDALFPHDALTVAPDEDAAARVSPMPETYVVREAYPVGHVPREARDGENEPVLIYRNTLGTVLFQPGAGNRVADDLWTRLAAPCALDHMRVRVTGGVEGGGGDFLAEVELYDGCPDVNADGQPIQGTKTLFGPLDDDLGIFHDLILDLSDRGICDDGEACTVAQQDCADASTYLANPLDIPPNIWMRIRFSSSSAALIRGAPAEVGFSVDGYDDVFGTCHNYFGGWPENPHASFWIEAYAAPNCDTHFLAYLATKPTGAPVLPTEIPGGSATMRLADDITLTVDDCVLSAYEIGMKGTDGPFQMSIDLRWPDLETVIPQTARTFIGRGDGTYEVAHFSVPPEIAVTVGGSDQPIFLTWAANASNTGVVDANMPDEGENLPGLFALDRTGSPGWASLYEYWPFAASATVFCRGERPVGACCPQGSAVPGLGNECFDNVPISHCPDTRWLANTTCDENLFAPPCGSAACCLPDGTCRDLFEADCDAVMGVWHASVLCATQGDDGTWTECPLGDGPLFPGAQYSVGERPYSVAIDDLNGNQVLDLVVANRDSDTVSVLLGVGDGTLVASADYDVGDRPRTVAIGDLDGDQVPDLVVANTHDTVTVLLGGGDGTFGAALDSAVGGTSYFVAIGDLDCDQVPDLVVADAAGDTVSVLLGAGDGTFQTAVHYGAGDAPVSVAIGDLDGDELADLVVANALGDTVSVLLGFGDGTFTAALNYAVGERPASLALGDLNGDGLGDIAVANSSSDTVSVLLGAGNGAFVPAVYYAVGYSPESVVISNLNGDHAPDLAVANYGSGSVSVLMGLGDGTMAAAAEYAVGDLPLSIGIGDFDGDWVPDLAVANYVNNSVSLLLGVGDGTMTSAVECAAGDNPKSIAIGDMNGDQVPDLTVANLASDDVSVLLGIGDGTYAAPMQFVAGDGPWSLAISDLNDDHVPDVAVANVYSDSVSVLLGEGQGILAAPLNFVTGDAPSSVVISDLNGDEVPDLAVAHAVGDHVSVLLGVGDGTFAAAGKYAAGDAPQSVATGDLDGDQLLDLVVANRFSDTVSVLLGVGGGMFASAMNYVAGDGPEFVAIGDLNGDSVPDLAVANSGGWSVSVLLGLGDGTFAAGMHFDAGRQPVAVMIGDLDADQVPDLAVANYAGDNVSVLLGIGDGKFASPLNFVVGDKPYSVAIGDLDGDYLLDMAVTNFGGESVYVLLNQRRAPCEIDGDSDVDLDDFALFARCIGGPGVTIPPTGCEPADFERSDVEGRDGEVSLNDYALFQEQFTGSR